MSDSRTQSVCKHCSRKISKCTAIRDSTRKCKGYIHTATGFHFCNMAKCTSVAEPASTGEPPKLSPRLYRFLRALRVQWLTENDPKDGTDCVTPFDEFLYEPPDVLKLDFLCKKCGGFIYKCMKFGHITPDSHLGAVRD